MTVRVRSVPPCVSSQIGSRHLPLKQGIVSSSLTWRTKFTDTQKGGKNALQKPPIGGAHAEILSWANHEFSIEEQSMLRNVSRLPCLFRHVSLMPDNEDPSPFNSSKKHFGVWCNAASESWELVVTVQFCPPRPNTDRPLIVSQWFKTRRC